MKRILTTAAVIATLGATSAIAASEMLREQVETQLDRYAMNEVDVSALTSAQVSALYLELSSTDSAADAQRAIDSIVRDSQYQMDETAYDMTETGADTGVRAVVQNELETGGYDVTVDELTDAQIGGLYIAFTGGDDADEERIEALLQ